MSFLLQKDWEISIRFSLNPRPLTEKQPQAISQACVFFTFKQDGDLFKFPFAKFSSADAVPYSVKLSQEHTVRAKLTC